MKNRKEVTIKMQSQQDIDAISPDIAGNTMLTMHQTAEAFRQECEENKKFVYQKKGSLK